MQVDKKVYSNENKDGIHFSLIQSPLLSFEGGVVNKNKINSFYYSVASHIEMDTMEPVRQLKLFGKEIRRIVHKYTSKSENILPRNISHFDYPENIGETRKGYFKLEFTFFNKGMDRKQIYDFLNTLCMNVSQEIELNPTMKLRNKRVNKRRY
jgi:hypothetical protein